MSETRSSDNATPSWTQMISEMIKNTIKIKIKYHLFKNKMYGVIGLAMKNSFRFATAKKTKMELTIRTPYRTIVSNFDGFSRVLAKTSEVLKINIHTGLSCHPKQSPHCHIYPSSWKSQIKLT